MEEMEREKTREEMDFLSALPECLLTAILSRTSPRDVCRSSAASKELRSVAESDAVWERFLPSDHGDIISGLAYGPAAFSTKKQLYESLTEIVLNVGERRFKIDKGSGKKRVVLEARELAITWGSVPEYWEWIRLPRTSMCRSSEVPEPPEERLFDLKGKIEARLLSPETTYVAYLMFKTWASYGSLGRAKTYVRFAGKKGDGYETTNIVNLEPAKSSHHLRKRTEGWMEIALGEFFTGQGDNGEVEIRLMEVEQGNWKGVISVQGIVLRPKV
ncbi:putative F-box protein PP2-B12 isoform X2 [Rhododendron vialii]|uniref:putative F-box protein PP2-B12 isoform X2 n=1 Tax=Rhododendron vialii TaxID=182163 RepID=UPI00265EB94C|nr:putative F-box protein PP2-B12 isoform X2 [Rhododendron vialii]